jgi:hypothetical protein
VCNSPGSHHLFFCLNHKPGGGKSQAPNHKNQIRKCGKKKEKDKKEEKRKTKKKTKKNTK